MGVSDQMNCIMLFIIGCWHRCSYIRNLGNSAYNGWVNFYQKLNLISCQHLSIGILTTFQTNKSSIL